MHGTPDAAHLLATRGLARSERLTAIALTVVGMDTFIIQPGLVDGFVQSAGLTEKQAGYVASAEMAGIALTSILMAWLAVRVRWRLLVRCALPLNAIANALCLAALDAGSLAAVRFLAGLASGVLISVGYAVIGRSDRAERDFGLTITWVLVYGALGLFVLPEVLASVGLKGAWTCFALAALAALAGSAHVPDVRAQAGAAGVRSATVSAATRLILLGCVFSFFLAQGVIWAYLSLIGLAAGADERGVANGLTIAQFFGIAGAFCSATLAPRLRPGVSLSAGLLLGVLPMGAFFLALGALVYGVAVSLFNFAANFVTPLLMAIVAGFDSSGSLVVRAAALQMLGLAIGPALGAEVISPGHFQNAITLSMGLCIACLVLGGPLLARQQPGTRTQRE